MTKFMYLLVALGLLAGGGAVAAHAGGDHPENVTLCHASGLAGTTKYETITVGYEAAFGPAGHFDENGTPNAGHEQDYLGECVDQPPPTDVCPNLEGDQGSLPEGYHFAEDENGRTVCVPDTPPPPTDVCPNLEGVQDKVPDGFVLKDGECVLIPPPPPPPGKVFPTGAAGVFCDSGAKLYRLVGSIDDQAADSVKPSTIPGNVKGVTNVVVQRGDTLFATSVTTLGDCDTSVAAVPPVAAPPVATPPVAPPAAKPPVVKPKPPAAKPKPKPVPKAKPRPKVPIVHICKPLHNGTKRVWVKGMGCHVVLPPEPKHLTG